MSKQDSIRIILDGISTIALVVTSVVLISATSRSSGELAGTGAATAPPPSESVDLTVAQTGHVMGSKDAKVVIIEFSDFQCPFCERFAKETLPHLKREFVEPGLVKFIYRHNPLDSIHPVASKAGAASYCADQQGRFWEMHDAIYAGDEELTASSFAEYARTLKLDLDKFSGCLAGEATAKVKADQAEAARLGLQSTPIFLIGRIEPDGSVKITRRVDGAVPYETFKAALKAVM